MARQNYAKYAIEQYAKRDPDVMLIESAVTDSDLDALEERMGIKLPVELRDYFQSYVVMGMPIVAHVYGDFVETYVEETGRWVAVEDDYDYICMPFDIIETPPGKELEQFEHMNDEYPEAGFVYVSSYFEQDHLLLDLESGKVYCLMEGLYDGMCDDMDGEERRKRILEESIVRFKSFHDLLECLFVGKVYDVEFD